MRERELLQAGFHASEAAGYNEKKKKIYILHFTKQPLEHFFIVYLMKVK